MSDARIDFYTNRRLIPDHARLKFGTGNDAELVWSTADSDNHSLVLALGDSNQALHVTDAGAVATDWNVAADTHPALYLHSNTTPATDYLKIGGHDGTNATIDLVGGTTLKIAFDGSAEIDISATALSPSIDGGNALGTTSLGWNGLHLNTGTAINWENGDVTLTHAAGKLKLGGNGAVEFDFANHEMTNVDIDSGAIDGTTIGAASAAAGTFAGIVGTSLSVSDGNITNVGDIALDSISADATNVNFAISGFVGINETANAGMTIGLTINQSTNDDEILAFKSSTDVAHGVTTLAETDTYFSVRKKSGAGGGTEFRSIADGSHNALWLTVIASPGSGDAGKLTSSSGTFTLDAAEASGTGTAAMTANANVHVIRNNGTTIHIIDEDGDTHYAGSDDGAITDAYDDISLLAGLRALRSPAGSPARDVFHGILRETEAILVQQGVLSAPLAMGGMVSTKGLNGLMIDGMRQLYDRINALEEQPQAVGA